MSETLSKEFSPVAGAQSRPPGGTPEQQAANADTQQLKPQDASWTTAWAAVLVPVLVGCTCGGVLGWGFTILDARLMHMRHPGIPMPMPFGIGPHQTLACLLISACYGTANTALLATPPDTAGGHWLRWAGACMLLAVCWSMAVVLLFGAALMGV